MRRTTVLLASIFVAAIAVTAALVIDAPAASAAGAGYVGKCGGGRILLNADEKRTFALHNQARKTRNLRLFCVDPRLQKVARAHSRDMIQRDYFSHTTKGTNRSGCDRVKNSGYRFRYCAENIAWGQREKGEPDNIMRSWMESSGHRRNILNGRYREVGIGTATGTFRGQRDVTTYTVDFGTRL